MFTLRAAPSGKIIRGTSNGQTVLWNEVSQAWDVGEITSLQNVYQFATLEDLEAAFPVAGGVHTLDESAVYIFVGDGFDLEGRRIDVTGAGAIVEGQGNTQITSSVTLYVLKLMAANQTLQNLRVRNTGSTTSLDRCAVETDQEGINIFGGQFDANGDGVGLVVGGNSQVNVWGTEFIGADLANVRYVAGSLLVDGAQFNGGAGPCVLVDSLAGLDLRVSDCYSVDNKTAFLEVDGSLTHIEMDGNTCGAPTAGAIVYTSGTVGSCSVMGGRMGGAVGIDWASNIPTRGLLVVGADILATTPFSGFTAATARVNVKACCGSAGLLAETAIVP